MDTKTVSDEQIATMLSVAGVGVGALPVDLGTLRAILTELQSLRSKPVASGVVKPLEWKQHTEGVWRAETLIGDYRVWTHHEADGSWFWNLSGGTITRSDKCASDEAGKAAAEADYRNRIMSALELPQPKAVTEEMVERACKTFFADEDWPVGRNSAEAITAKFRMAKILRDALS